MQRLLLSTCLSLFCLVIAACPVTAEDFITLSLPESVIAKAATAILPLQIDASSKSMEGVITIVDIKDLRLTENHLSCRLHMTGSNLAILTEIAGHEIRLKVGSLEIAFNTRAAVRFDRKRQTLIIKPTVENVAGKSSMINGDIGQALAALLNGREFPVSLQNLDPLIARTGAKTITINSRITDIEAAPKRINLSLAPEISAR